MTEEVRTEKLNKIFEEVIKEVPSLQRMLSAASMFDSLSIHDPDKDDDDDEEENVYDKLNGNEREDDFDLAGGFARDFVRDLPRDAFQSRESLLNYVTGLRTPELVSPAGGALQELSGAETLEIVRSPGFLDPACVIGDDDSRSIFDML